MPATNVNITTSNYQTTGVNVNFPQVSFDLAVEWDDAEGHHSVTQNVKFPNVLQNAALDNAWLKDQLQGLMYEAIRKVLGLDE